MTTSYRRRVVTLLACAVVALTPACTRDGRQPPGAGGTSAPAASAPVSGPSTGGPGTGATGPAGAPTSPVGASSAPPSEFRVTYDWAVPTGPVSVDHRLRVPIAPPPAEPLPVLVRIDVGDHPDTGFTRMTFAFRGALPGYEVAYVPRVEADGGGERVALPGNAFLRVRFDQAQAHRNSGASSVVSKPPASLGYPTLRGYAPAGDYEGAVTVGLGLQVAAGSDEALPIRLGESRRPDGTYAVSIDVRRG